jgi:thioredoxin 1
MGKQKMIRRFNRIINSTQPVLVDFYADWCMPCRLMPPVLKEVKEQFKKHIRIIKVNVDHYPDIAVSCRVQNIPAVVVFQDGKIQWSGIGVQGVNDISIALREML